MSEKVVGIAAVRWDGALTTIEPLLAGSSTPEVYQELGDLALYIPTPEGVARADVGDWITRRRSGELIVCHPDDLAGET